MFVFRQTSTICSPPPCDLRSLSFPSFCHEALRHEAPTRDDVQWGIDYSCLPRWILPLFHSAENAFVFPSSSCGVYSKNNATTWWQVRHGMATFTRILWAMDCYPAPCVIVYRRLRCRLSERGYVSAFKTPLHAWRPPRRYGQRVAFFQ